MKLEISRAKWLRGEGSEDSYLIRQSDGKQCCLGFFGLAAGIEADKMLSVQTPEEVPITETETVQEVWTRKFEEAGGLFSEYLGGLSGTCSKLMEANDDENETEEAREELISKLFQKIGVEVVFVD